MRRHPFHLERRGDRPIHGHWHLPTGEAHGTVLFLHGYKGYMDWGAWSMVGDVMAHAGWRFLRINFTHNGTTPEYPSRFVDLEAFGRNTYRRERDEAVDVLRALRSEGTILDAVAVDGPLAVIGHSRGGGIACLAAEAADQLLKAGGLRGVDMLITWAAVADFSERFPKGAELDAWRESGRLEVINHRTRQRMHHDLTFHEDFVAHEASLNIKRAVERFAGRVLVAHGEEDAAVGTDHAERIASWARQGKRFTLEGAGHTFDATEPWDAPILPAALDALTQTTLLFLEEGRAVQP